VRAIKKPFLILFLTGSITLVGVSPKAETNPSPEISALMGHVLNPPVSSYKGHLMITSWSGKDTQAEDVTIYYRPQNRYRLEFLAPNGTVDRAVLSDNGHQQILVMQNGQPVQDVIAPLAPTALSRDDERNLVMKNYKVSVKDAAPILGRSTWLVELTPLIAGKPTHQLRVDRTTYVILESKQFSKDGGVGSLMRFTEFQPGTPLADSLFLKEAGLKKEAEITPLSADKIGTSAVRLAGGFSLESVDYFDITGKSVRHVRYTDGLVPLSLFETPQPVKVASQGTTNSPSFGPMQAGFSAKGRVCSWQKNKQYYTLIADLDDNLLQNIAKDLK
jgi:outer membrane lipoprotein-sorting protein